VNRIDHTHNSQASSWVEGADSHADFPVQDLPPGGAGQGSAQRRLYALGQWSRDLATSARHAEHPYSPGLMLEALVSRAQQALRAS
jgi:DNA polymerase-3 subunit delta'